MPQEDNTIFEKPSCHGEYVEDLLKSPRDFPSSPKSTEELASLLLGKGAVAMKAAPRA
jgi:hypothetical protein